MRRCLAMSATVPGLVRLQSVAVRGCPSAVPMEQAFPRTCAPRLAGCSPIQLLHVLPGGPVHARHEQCGEVLGAQGGGSLTPGVAL